MRLPAFLAEMGSEANRPKLLMGTQSGYAIAIACGVLGIIAQWLDVAPTAWALHGLVIAKLITNTLARLALKFQRLELEFGGLNVAMDVVVMTGAIYLTGGQISPLFPIFAIELTVVALLTNMGVTVLVVLLALTLYATMAILTFAGAIPFIPPPLPFDQQVTASYLIVDLLFSSLVLGVPAFFLASMLRQLRTKEDALDQKRRDIVEANQQKTQFMANVTHELRTPIHGILGLSELVSTGIYGPVTDKQVIAHSQIVGSAKGLLKLIDNLLELSRAEVGKLVYRPAPVDVEEVVTSVVASTKWMIGTQNIDLRVELSNHLPQIVTDRGMLNQVLVNLLSNAVKFTPEGGRITMRASEGRDDTVVLTVQDTGIGIPRADRKAIFEQFKQVDGSMERKFGGVGIGLALVDRFVRVMGGSLTLDSTPGKGSTFEITLPVAGPSEEAVKREIRRKSVMAITARFGSDESSK